MEQIQPQRRAYYSDSHVAIIPQELISLTVWCRKEAYKTALPLTFMERWVVAQYQYDAAVNWPKGNICRYQQLAAAAIHLLCMGELENLKFYSMLDVDYCSWPTLTFDETRRDAIAAEFCKHSQLVFYRAQANKHRNNKIAYNYYQRALRRAPAHKFKKALTHLIFTLISCIPKTRRKEAFYHEMKIMCGDLNA